MGSGAGGQTAGHRVVVPYGEALMKLTALFHGRGSICLIWLCSLLLTGIYAASAPGALADELKPFSKLKARLVADGFDPQWIEEIYSNAGTVFEARGVSQYFRHNEATLDYGQFSSRRNIRDARRYMTDHKSELDAAESRFGVDPAVITAIILVETKLGTYLGNRSILSTLSTMAALTEDAAREIVWESIPDEGRFTRPQFEKKADTKADWAYRELKAFLNYVQRQRMDPTEINGSYAGALGIAQFMPSNILSHGEDGNQDGRVDLFTHADAISSIASYLKYYGWKPGLDRKSAGKVIYHYNHSPYYVEAILVIAEKLKG
jgi:membrane-bound lytic murein transglycosylase B